MDFIAQLDRALRDGCKWIDPSFSYVIREKDGAFQVRLLEMTEWIPCSIGHQPTDREIEAVLDEAWAEAGRQAVLPL